MENQIEAKGDNLKKDNLKMDRRNRAKQFIPFDPLKGFQEALREKEHMLVSQKKPSKGEERKQDDKV